AAMVVAVGIGGLVHASQHAILDGLLDDSVALFIRTVAPHHFVRLGMRRARFDPLLQIPIHFPHLAEFTIPGPLAASLHADPPETRTLPGPSLPPNRRFQASRRETHRTRSSEEG